MESLFKPKFEDYSPGRDSQKAQETVLLIRSKEDAVHMSFWRQRVIASKQARIVERILRSDLIAIGGSCEPLEEDQEGVLSLNIDLCCMENIVLYS